MIRTERLLLREMDGNDYDALYRVLADSDSMRHYPDPFDEKRVRGWIAKNIDRCRSFGFGLWAVCLRESGEMIGDCGLTLQNINGKTLPEIGFHIRRDCQRKGYAGEAAKAVRDWAFRNTEYPSLYSCCKYTNVPSIKTAESVGMRFVCEYPDEANGTSHVSAISREEWLNELTENTISWAEQKLGCKEYAGWCLSFIEDSLEKSNGIEIFGGDSAKASALLYADGMRRGIPERGAFVFYDCISQGPDGPVNWGHCGVSLGDHRLVHAWDRVRIDEYREIEAMTARSGDHPRYIGWVPIERVLQQKP